MNRFVDTTKVRSEKVVAHDPWGNECDIIVRWRPLVLEGVEPASDNVGRSLVLWAEDCPAWLERDRATNRLKLVRDRKSTSGEIESIDTARRVALDADLQEGEFSVEVIRDDAGAIGALTPS